MCATHDLPISNHDTKVTRKQTTLEIRAKIETTSEHMQKKQRNFMRTNIKTNIKGNTKKSLT